MKQFAKRTLALVLSLLMLLPAAALAVQAATRVDLPIIYVAGKYAEIYNADESQRLYPLDPPAMQTVTDNLEPLYKAYIAADTLGKWKEFADKIYDTLAPRFEPLVMDDSGNPRYRTHTKALPAPVDKKSGYWLHDYMFKYDSRLDPYENARYLDIYINNVLAVTGKKQVNLIGRCLGTTVVATYLTQYGCEKVRTAIFYASAFNGVYMMDGFFSCDFDLNYDRIKAFLDKGYMDMLGNFDSMRNGAETLDKLGLFGPGVKSANTALQKLRPYLFPRLTLAIFGTWPGHWAMISKEAFQKAKETTLADTEKYANLINKVERYQNNVMAKFPETLEKCRQEGMHFAIICKYNIPIIPLSPNSSLQADGTVELKTMSLGATAADIDHILPTKYIKDLQSSGNDQYLSPDYVVDASTCQYPEYTWFIKDCPHAAYPTDFNQFFLTIFRSQEQVDIHTYPEFPQFTAYNKDTDTIRPLTSADTPDLPNDEEPNDQPTGFQLFLQRLREFFQRIADFFRIG